MAEKKCKSCAMIIPAEAKVCPFCRKTQPTKAVWWLLLIIVMSFGYAFSFNNNAPPKSAEQIIQDKKEIEAEEAKIIARDFVKQRLKAPSTAKFQSTYNFAVQEQKDGSWKVQGYVDAQNSFSAMIRNNFQVVVKKGPDHWQLVKFDMWQ